MMITFILSGCYQKRTINFKEELDFKFAGTNGNSTVTITPKQSGEIEKFKEEAEIDYKRVSQSEPLNPETDKLYAIKEGYFYTCSTDADLDKLKNGDVITYSCSIPADLEKEYNIKIENEKFDVTVSGLEENTKTENTTEDKTEKRTDACDIKEKC